MNITDVRIRKVNEEGKMKAVASVTFDDEFVVHDIKIIEGQHGLFIAMPSRKLSEGEFRDIAHPLVSETRNKIKVAIFAEYERILAEKQLAETQSSAATEDPSVNQMAETQSSAATEAPSTIQMAETESFATPEHPSTGETLATDETPPAEEESALEVESASEERPFSFD